MIDVLETLGQLFADHAPETLMALFGAATSILLFYLVWYLLRHLLGQTTQSASQDADQEQATAALVETLVGELLVEAEHLRRNLQDLLQRGEENAETLSTLMVHTERAPEQLVELLHPEFAHLQQEIRLAEGRIVARIAEAMGSKVTNG